MAVVEKSNVNKSLYKVELYLLKILPMLTAAIYLVNTILSYFDIIVIELSFLGGISIIPLLFMYLSSYVFRFCEYHRMFLHYIVFNDVMEIINYYTDIISENLLYLIYLIVIGVTLFIILYLYVKNHKKPSS